jgi:hypothetical protein
MIAMPETTLNEKTYTTEESKKNILVFSTSAEVVECYPSEKFEVEYTQTLDNQTYPDELAGYSLEARESIMRGLSQTETKSLGSFAEYAECSDE